MTAVGRRELLSAAVQSVSSVYRRSDNRARPALAPVGLTTYQRQALKTNSPRIQACESGWSEIADRRCALN